MQNEVNPYTKLKSAKRTKQTEEHLLDSTESKYYGSVWVRSLNLFV